MHRQYWRALFDRPKTVNKYDLGHVLVVGGAPQMPGAPLLAGEAALRTGAGLVTIASTEYVAHQLAGRVEELMIFALPNYSEHQAKKLSQFISTRHVTVLVIGPGLPPEASALVRTLVAKSHLPTIIDGGALDAFAGRLAELATITSNNRDVILTPHPGEFSRLTGDTASDKASLLFAIDHKVTVVLKHANTFVAYADSSAYRNATGNPGLATAGTGDTLTGVIAALLAQKIPTKPAVEMAVYLHGLAGDMAAKEKTQPGMIATDVIAQLPGALRAVKNTQGK